VRVGGLHGCCDNEPSTAKQWFVIEPELSVAVNVTAVGDTAGLSAMELNSTADKGSTHPKLNWRLPGVPPSFQVPV
jgi:hypothetical protein